MNTSTKPIIVIETIGNKKREIVLTKQRVVPIYHITIDKEYLGDVLQINFKWCVVPFEGSWLKDENTDAILQAVLNAETPNS